MHASSMVESTADDHLTVDGDAMFVVGSRGIQLTGYSSAVGSLHEYNTDAFALPEAQKDRTDLCTPARWWSRRPTTTLPSTR